MDYSKYSVCFFPVLMAYLMNSYWSELSILFKSRVLGVPRVELVVGVVSARDHWEERQAIRDTWMGHAAANQTLADSVTMKFIVGSRACLLPPMDREDEKSCKPWTRKHPEQDAYTLVTEEMAETESKEFVPNYVVQQLRFKVLQPVIMTHLGIHAGCLRGRLTVRLMDSRMEKEIVSAQFKPEDKTEQTGFLYKEVQSFMLPKGFEGIVVGENQATSNPGLAMPFNKVFNLSLDQPGGYLQIVQHPIPDLDHYTDPQQLAYTHLPIVSFVYQIHEKEEFITALKTTENRRREWLQAVEKEDEKLRKEQETFGDLVFVDTVDVYSNISRKIVQFHEWVERNFEFAWLMKTDDDCYVDVEKIYDSLQTLPQDNVWWGRFRHNWPVEHVGKWAELEYRAAVYPSFACGAGNVLSRDLVRWIVHNAPLLHHYQGEDISLGIWLSAVSPQYIDDVRWQCEGECVSDMYVMPQLHHTELPHYWNNSQQCGDPCGC